MKKIIAALALTVSLFAVGCKGNPQGAVGANDKGDTTSFDKEDSAKGRSEETQGDSLQKNIGPAKDKNHVTDSEDKKKH
jgi:hypothetical protein